MLQLHQTLYNTELATPVEVPSAQEQHIIGQQQKLILPPMANLQPLPNIDGFTYQQLLKNKINKNKKADSSLLKSLMYKV